jgi:hypothetical protein
MLCPNCRSIQPDGADYCSICAVNMRAYVSQPYGQSTAMYPPPPPPYQVPPAGMIKDYMSMSIISLVGNILFFNIFGEKKHENSKVFLMFFDENKFIHKNT